MKKALIGISVASMLAFGSMAFAQGMMGGRGGGHMMNPGSMMGSDNMTGPGNGGHMGGWTGPGNSTGQTDQKFLDDTAGLRRELHNKQFEYQEAFRNPDTSPATVRALENEILELQKKIYEKSPRARSGYSPY